MRQRIQNKLMIEYTGDVDLTKSNNIVVYVRQGNLFFEKTPVVVDATHAYITIEYQEAMRLRHGVDVKMQTAFTDENGTPLATDVVCVSVAELINVEGYDGN